MSPEELGVKLASQTGAWERENNPLVARSHAYPISSLEKQFCDFLRRARDNSKESPSRLIGL
jgi:hypothetical protein